MTLATLPVTRRSSRASVELRRVELEESAHTLVRTVLCFGFRDRVAAAMPDAWEAGMCLYESDDPEDQRQGVHVLLNVLAATPNEAREHARRVLAELPDYHGRDEY